MSPAEKAAYRGPREYIVWSSSAKMPIKCWGVYRRVAVLEVLPGVRSVSMISDRAKGVLRVVATWERCRVGTTDRCATSRAEAAAIALADKLTREATFAPLLADVTEALVAQERAA